MTTFLLTLLAFLLFIVLAAVGVLFGRRALQGSCGGLGRFGLTCDGGCSNPCPRKERAARLEEPHGTAAEP